MAKVEFRFKGLDYAVDLTPAVGDVLNRLVNNIPYYSGTRDKLALDLTITDRAVEYRVGQIREALADTNITIVDNKNKGARRVYYRVDFSDTFGKSEE
jgi:hypothetical protein